MSLMRDNNNKDNMDKYIEHVRKVWHSVWEYIRHLELLAHKLAITVAMTVNIQ